MRMDTEALAYEILSVVEEIPEGNVATYGQIARLIGREKKRAIKLGKVDFFRFCGYTENKSKFEWDEECPNSIIKQKE